MVVFLKVLAIAAVGGVAFVFMRPHVPILPPALIGKRRRMAMSELEDYDEEALSDEAAIHEVSQFFGAMSFFCCAAAPVLIPSL